MWQALGELVAGVWQKPIGVYFFVRWLKPTAMNLVRWLKPTAMNLVRWLKPTAMNLVRWLKPTAMNLILQDRQNNPTLIRRIMIDPDR